MAAIPVYDPNGKIVNRLIIDDYLDSSDGRVCKGLKNYYKGVGTKYQGHHLLNDITDEYEIVDKCDVFYMGTFVKKKCFLNKEGIFQEKFQPQFTDFIGSCGVKELSMIENSKEFERSSVDILNVHNYDKDNQQYYFELNYKCKRVKYIDDPDPEKLRLLLDYMITNDWNFIWDKTSITDISYSGMVTDVADIFKSKDISNKLGSVYSVLYSMAKIDKDLYMDFIKYNGMDHPNDMYYVFNAMQILFENKVNTDSIFIPGTRFEIYKNVVLNHLVTGRNCGDCCYVDLGENIRRKYIELTKAQFNMT